MKILLLTLIISISLVANSLDTKRKILSFIVDNVSITQKKIIYSDNQELLKDIARNTQTVTKCQDATLLIIQEVQKISPECLEKTLFVLDYDSLEKLPTSFGAFFFKKGRANIVFIRPRLKKENIIISHKLDDYLEEKIW